MISRKMIGAGNTAVVYEWEEGKVLKLFNHGYPYEAVTREYDNAMAINGMDFAKPRAYEMITYEGKNGILYDKIEGQSLLDWVLKTGNLQQCAECMAKTHKTIINNEISNVPDYKVFLKHHIQKVLLTKEKQQEAFSFIDKLEDGNTVCHGDFHPGNILISKGNAFVIDFMNICHGNFLYDIARTVFLIEYTPVPEKSHNKNMLQHTKKDLADLYLEQMNVTKDRLHDYLSVISIARKGEYPDE